jgi:hypothetical protein
MTDSNVTKELEKKLLSFITEEDPMLYMLQWITEKFMEIEVANKVGAQKGEHSPDRTTHLSCVWSSMFPIKNHLKSNSRSIGNPIFYQV